MALKTPRVHHKTKKVAKKAVKKSKKSTNRKPKIVIRSQVWAGCRMDTCFYDQRPALFETNACDVRLDSAGNIVVTYDDPDGQVFYSGRDLGSGHFRLTFPKRQAEATLHRFSHSKILEGYWREAGDEGMWRIRLGRVPRTVVE